LSIRSLFWRGKGGAIKARCVEHKGEETNAVASKRAGGSKCMTVKRAIGLPPPMNEKGNLL
jgi:hypothetical protein